jgi:5-oxoprolinase (ATP-hydrolysing)
MDPAGFSIPIRIEDARAALDAVLARTGDSDWQAVAEGFLQIATERMAHAIRKVSLREGEDPGRYGLVVFGGAGGLHACRLAEVLGMERIIFPPDAGILSARGIHFAPREVVLEQQCLLQLDEAVQQLPELFAGMCRGASESLLGDGIAKGKIAHPECTVFVRMAGQETGIPVAWQDGADLKAAFGEKFSAVFGYLPRRPVLEIVKLRVRTLERVLELQMEDFPGDGAAAEPAGNVRGYAKGAERDIPVFAREALSTGNQLRGPAIIRDPFGTCFIEDGWIACTGSLGSIELKHCEKKQDSGISGQLANVERTLVLNRLEGLVEEMGDQLQRTALSTNIRERLDFSCALLDAEGRLLVNAPHIPVHLGAMGLCVRECVRLLKPGPGDVIITNHPAFGGSHLPDVTLLCGLYDDNGGLMGYLANRAHHAELGGRSPGSMPADAVRLVEEGIIISPRWLIRDGMDHFSEIEELLESSPFPSRAVRENRIDLEAQLAALQRGRALFEALRRDYSPQILRGYFHELYNDSAKALVYATAGLQGGSAIETLDDGHEIKVRIEGGAGHLLIDFEGTSPHHPGNLNATPAIVRSAVLYVLRLLVDAPLPLNEGLLDSVEIRLPPCFLNPSFPEDPGDCPAVVGGNVETSQRVVDALIRAFGLMAAGQGTMNNLLFGNESFGYYETVGGGAGAGDGFEGASGLHVHMTNTAITDPEILEQRFPVTCREFSLRNESGGKGRFKGGDGLVREILFKEDVSVSLLTQNRVCGPLGMAGGGNGAPGRQWLVRTNGLREPVAGIAQLQLKAGESIRLETPGGGGWGSAVR